MLDLDKEKAILDSSALLDSKAVLDNVDRAENTPTDVEREQMIIFSVGEQEYCIPILSIREIREFEEPTYLPHCPSYVEGAINIRGNIITVLSLARYLDIEVQKDNDRRVVIIVEDSQRETTCGLLVDNVIGIVEVLSNQIHKISVDDGAPELSGLVNIEGRVIRILRLNTVLSRLTGEDISSFQNAD